MSEQSTGRYSVIRRSVAKGVRSESYLLRAYTVVGVLASAFIALLLVLAIPQWVKWTLGQGELNTFSRAMLPWLAMLLVGPLLAPPFYAARRAGRGDSSRRTDFWLALAGFAFLASLYVMLLVSAPAEYRDPAPDVPLLGAFVEFCYALDPVFAFAPPVVGVVVIVAVERLAR
ncbi:hypothetical protein [Haloarchaeobius litoreus]|uniref:DUF8056 domain-containing protein n=1 Tax=Haloarchaeobius litoreus TaxID=755306 RepID=A0ABD6DMT9_9EURY|nr:hypothetical protein [Haloarchaeobius litoreus]